MIGAAKTNSIVKNMGYKESRKINYKGAKCVRTIAVKRLSSKYYIGVVTRYNQVSCNFLVDIKSKEIEIYSSNYNQRSWSNFEPLKEHILDVTANCMLYAE